MTTALTNCRLVDGTGAGPQEGAALVIEDGRIAAIGARSDLTLSDDCRIIDLDGRTVLPGFIDGHMHVTSMPGLLDHLGHVQQNLQAVGKLQQCLEWGTTTVANVGGCPETVLLREAIDAGQIRGCASVLVGAMVNATGGHVRGRSADGPWEVRKAVREMAVSGCDFIKTAASGGFMWEHEDISWEDYTIEELRALVEESHGRGKRVHVHAHAQPGLAHSIEVGCDVILHGALIDEPALEGIAARDLWYMPTLHITSEEIWSHPSRPPHMKERMQKADPIHRQGVTRAREMGIRVSGGTDGGPGDICKEMVELVGCGYTPLEAIGVVTRNSADALGLLDTAGTLEAGKSADLLVVAGDPLTDITALTRQDNILAVMKSGITAVVRDDALLTQFGCY